MTLGSDESALATYIVGFLTIGVMVIGGFVKSLYSRLSDEKKANRDNNISVASRVTAVELEQAALTKNVLQNYIQRQEVTNRFDRLEDKIDRISEAIRRQE